MVWDPIYARTDAYIVFSEAYPGFVRFYNVILNIKTFLLLSKYQFTPTAKDGRIISYDQNTAPFHTSWARLPQENVHVGQYTPMETHRCQISNIYVGPTEM